MAAVRRAWHEAGRHEAALVAGIVLLLAGLAFGRADVALLGLPAMLGAVFARTRPAPAPLLVGEQPAADESLDGITSAIRVSGGELAHVRVTAPGHRTTEFVARLPPQGGRTFTLELASRRTGPQRTALADVRGYSDGWECEAPGVGDSTRLVLPTVTPLTRVPVPRRLRGRLRLHPQALGAPAPLQLDSAGSHQWWPIAPCARIEVDLADPGWRWQGHAYLDSNRGSAPLEQCFASWQWARAALDAQRSAVAYDALELDGTARHIALQFDHRGGCAPVVAPPMQDLPRTAVFRVPRSQRSRCGLADSLRSWPS